ncbi:MAG TPA: tetratricopeptide repeat protein [Myxococcaceae bacterium]|nr:tetratricopeptide repeat protein [Myxococcaceae bacterium]
MCEVRLLAIALLVAIAAGCSRSGPEHLARARELVYARKPQAALREYRAALDTVEKSEGPEAAHIRAAALRGAADVYWLELHDVPKAVSVYKELVAQVPDAPETAEAHVVLASILESHYRDLRGAISELTAALARDPPTAPDLRYHVAKLYFELGDYQQSELEARTLIQKFPSSPLVDDGWMLVGQSLSMREGMRPEAMTAYATLIQQFPASELVPHALFELGKLRGEAGDDAGAIQAWVQALERHPDPQIVQSAIARTRKRIAQTTPRGVGVREAFQRPEPHRVVQARTSLEAAGGTAEQAAREHGD